MRAGRLRHRVTLQVRTVARNTHGEETPTWTDHATVWAEATGIGGTEGKEAGQIQAAATHQVRIRFRRNITPAWRVKWGARVMDIKSILPDARRTELTLLCSEDVT